MIPKDKEEKIIQIIHTVDEAFQFAKEHGVDLFNGERPKTEAGRAWLRAFETQQPEAWRMIKFVQHGYQNGIPVEELAPVLLENLLNG